MELINVKKGKRVQFINHEFDHFMEAFLVKDRKEAWANGFKIILNGKLVHTSQTFKSFKTKCNTLISEWDLEEY